VTSKYQRPVDEAIHQAISSADPSVLFSLSTGFAARELADHVGRRRFRRRTPDAEGISRLAALHLMRARARRDNQLVDRSAALTLSAILVMLDPELVPESLADEAWVLAAQMGSDLLLVRPELLAKASAMPAPRELSYQEFTSLLWVMLMASGDQEMLAATRRLVNLALELLNIRPGPRAAEAAKATLLAAMREGTFPTPSPRRNGRRSG
jgi:hypothetical protein